MDQKLSHYIYPENHAQLNPHKPQTSYSIKSEISQVKTSLNLIYKEL